MLAPTPRPAIVARAPGRVNLIGDHTDYCGGLAMPMAIDRWTEVAYRPDPDDRHLTLTTDVDPAAVAVDLGRGTVATTPSWGRLASAVVGLAGPAAGGRVEVRSTVPPGAGLSSSAAFSVALALALGADGDPMALARLCQQAEAMAGSEVGLLDPLAIAGARAGHAMVIDFGALGWEHVPLPEAADVVVVHSGVPRQLGSSPYRARRAECEAAAAGLGIALGAARDDDVGRLDDPVLRARARHVVTECRRVREVATALAHGDLRAAGAAMTESHRSLAGDFAASTPEVDALVHDLAGRPGVHGARMTGGGFGGCVVALAEPGSLDPARWPDRCWVVRPAGPAARVTTGMATGMATGQAAVG